MNAPGRSIPLLFRLRRFAAPPLVPLLVGLTLLLPLAGCLSTEVRTHDGSGEASAVRIRVFTSPNAVERRRADGTGTLVELFRLGPGNTETFLQRSLSAQWGVDGLPAGRYRLKVEAVLDPGGNIRDPRSGDRVTDFEVERGKTADVAVVLRETPTGLIIVAAITVVLIVVALAILFKDSGGELPVPPLPHELLKNLPPPPLRHVVFWGEIHGGFPVGGPGTASRDSVPPRITSIFPEPGSLVAARRIAPAITFSQAVELSELGPSTIRMLGSSSGIVPGTTAVRKGMLRFEPSRDLLPGETVTVTVLAAEIENAAGQELESDFSWTFRMADR